MKLKNKEDQSLVALVLLGFSAEFYQTLKEDLILIVFNLFHKLETGGTLLNLFYESTVTLIPESYKDPTK